ncbi:MAG: FMN-binding negative transcriptional regulator [Acetobacteraceae bacterium]|nr:FMN-binding negative transcriptional regulator [Acetobacteraceae bacterium]
MYNPAQFREDRVPVLQDAIRQSGLGTLITYGPDGLIATHAPMRLTEGPGPYGTLWGHVSRANSQWRRSAPDIDALAIFLGPDAYVSPAWYETKRQTGKVVPTWNYVAIHAYGPAEFFDDPDRLLEVVTSLTDTHEARLAGQAERWAVSDAPPDFVRAQLKGIVGFRLPIARLEGKWKMSQNRPEQDRAGVVAGLAAQGGSGTEVAKLVAAALPGTEKAT